jgi:hypothetical protein
MRPVASRAVIHPSSVDTYS